MGKGNIEEKVYATDRYYEISSDILIYNQVPDALETLERDGLVVCIMYYISSFGSQQPTF